MALRCQSTGIPTYQPMSTLFPTVKSTATQRLNAFTHPWTYQVRYVFCTALVLLVMFKFLTEHVN